MGNCGLAQPGADAPGGARGDAAVTLRTTGTRPDNQESVAPGAEGCEGHGCIQGGALPGGNADGLDPVPAGRPALAGEFGAWNQQETVVRRQVSGPGIPSRASLEVYRNRPKGLRMAAGEIEFEAGYAGQVAPQGEIPVETVGGSRGERAGEDHARIRLGGGRGFTAGSPGAGRAGSGAVEQENFGGGNRRRRDREAASGQSDRE